MMRKVSGLLVLCVVLFSVTIGNTQEPTIEIKELSYPDWTWGNQPIPMKVINPSDYVRFVVIRTELKFVNVHPLCERENRFSAYLEPGISAIAPVVTVPGNYGAATMRMTFFDVVDTMDVVLPGQEILDTTIDIQFGMPATAEPWVDKMVLLPPRVEQHPFFDNQFARLLIQFVSSQTQVADIARITNCEPTFVRRQLGRLERYGFIRKGPTFFELNFPLIEADEVAQARQISENLAAALAERITQNLTDYDIRLDSLVKAGAVPDDRGDLMGVSGVLYEPYVVTSALLLWYELGSQFVTPGKPLNVFERSDICNALNMDYMYAVPADDGLVGRHFFAYQQERTGQRILFADHVPNINCHGNFPARPGVAGKARWKNDPDDQSDFYGLDTASVRPVLNILNEGIGTLLEQSLAELESAAAKAGRTELTPGYKYWFWNMTATRALDILTEQQVVVPSGKTYFLLGSMPKL